MTWTPIKIPPREREAIWSYGMPAGFPPLPPGYMYLGRGKPGNEHGGLHLKFHVPDPNDMYYYDGWDHLPVMNGNNTRFHYACPEEHYPELKENYE